jgi:hypothetical protein
MSIAQQNLTPITHPDLNSVFEAMLPLVKSNPQYINAYLLTGSPEQKLAAAMIKDMSASQPTTAPAQAPTQTIIQQKLAGLGGLQQGTPAPQAGQPPMPLGGQPQMPPQGGQQVAMNAAGGMIAFDEGGIAALPIRDSMYNEDSFAHGGIVGFAGPDGSYVLGEDYDPTAMMDAYSAQKAAEEMRYRTTKPEHLFASAPYNKNAGAVGAWMQNFENKAAIDRNAKTPFDAAIQYYDSIGDVNGKIMAQKQRTDWLANPTSLMENAGIKQAKPSAATIAPPTSPTSDITPAKPAVPAIDTALGKPTSAGPASPSAPSISSDIGKQFGLSTIDPKKYLPTQETMTDVEKEQADAYARAGVSDKPYEAGLASIAKRREKIAKDEDRAGAVGLAQFGFGMLGAKQGQEFDYMSKEGGKAFDAYNTAKDKLELRSEQLDDKEQGYNLAQNEYMRNRTDANLSRVRASKDKLNDAKQSLEVANTNIKNKGQELQLNVALKKLELDSSNFNYAQTRELQRLALEKPDAFSTMLDAVNSVPNLTKMQRAEELVELTKKATSASEGYTLRAVNIKAVEDMFKDRSTPLGKMYNAISENNKKVLEQQGYKGKTGLAAANAYKDAYKKEQIATYGPKGAARQIDSATPDPLGIL